MSLRTFHIFFIFVSTLLLVWLEFWGIRSYFILGNSGGLVMAGFALVGFLVMVGYAGWFLSKFRMLGRQ